MSSVFSMELEGMTRAWPMAPLMRRKTRPTQNHAMISRRIFCSVVSFSCGFFEDDAFTDSPNLMEIFRIDETTAASEFRWDESPRWRKRKRDRESRRSPTARSGFQWTYK